MNATEIKQELYKVFANVTLDDGTTFYEACIAHNKKQAKKKKLKNAERNNWQNLLEDPQILIENCFDYYDAKGLKFHLPIYITYLLEQKSKDELIDDIHNAFANVKLEDGVGLYEAEIMDERASKEVRQKVRKHDEKEDWKRLVGNKDFLQKDEWMAFCDEKGLRFHLPAYMIVCLENKGESGKISPEFLWGSISRCLQILNKQQKSCLQNFKTYYCKENLWNSILANILGIQYLLDNAQKQCVIRFLQFSKTQTQAKFHKQIDNILLKL